MENKDREWPQENSQSTNDFDCNKISGFCLIKWYIKLKMTKWEKISVVPKNDKGVVSRIYNEYRRIHSKLMSGEN